MRQRMSPSAPSMRSPRRSCRRNCSRSGGNTNPPC
jgi:hypothetical protein